MKSLQKLPKNPGDNLFLGSVVACGIKTDSSQFFVSFDCNGELVSYLVDRSEVMDVFITELTFRTRETNPQRLKDRVDLEYSISSDNRTLIRKRRNGTVDTIFTMKG